MHRLEEPGPSAERRRWQQAERAGQHRRFIAENVAEHVLGQDDVERRRIRDQPHRSGIDVAVLEPHLGIVARDPRHGFAPQLRDFQHVRLVDGRDETSPASRRGEGHARDPLDLRRRVYERVDRPRALTTARLPVIQAAGQLTHDEHVDAA